MLMLLLSLSLLLLLRAASAAIATIAASFATIAADIAIGYCCCCYIIAAAIATVLNSSVLHRDVVMASRTPLRLVDQRLRHHIGKLLLMYDYYCMIL